jgi:hypothetical protein
MPGLFDPEAEQHDTARWIPALAGMTIKGGCDILPYLLPGERVS